MKHKGHGNYYFLGIAIILLLFGTLFLATLSSIESLQAFGNTNYYLFHQLIAIGLGVLGGCIAFKFPLPLLKKLSPWLFLINLTLLAMVFLPFLGINFWGASRWIRVGGMSFQPSEFFKITVILYLSSWMSNRFPEGVRRSIGGLAKKGYDQIRNVFLPFIVLLGLVVVIFYFQKDASTLGIVLASLLAIYFASGTPVWNLLLLLLTGIAGGLLLIRIEPYRMQRFLVFLHPDTDPLGIGFQLKQSILAIGSGGIFGKGLGMSTQKFGFLPQAMSDSIFGILGEETGIIGCSVIILLFFGLFWQGIRIAKNSHDTFGRLAAIGICTWIITQALMNIASAVGLFPVTGVPLPFFSYGGSHIMAELVAIGLMFNISKNG